MNVVFDWAGTLADDRELTWRLTDQVIRSFGHAGVDYETYRREFTLPAEGFYRKHCPGTAWERIEAAFAETCRRLYPAAVKLHAGVREGLACLACRHRLFILSTLDQSMLEETLERLDVRRHFQAVRGSAENKVAALPALLRAWNLAQDETVLIGDTPHDVKAAQGAGIEPLAVSYGYASREELLAAEPESLYDSFGEVLRRLDKQACAESRHFPVATVGGLIRDDDGRMLLIRTRKWSGKYGIPGGKIDYGETMEAAFVREAKEETGLDIREVAFVMNQDCVEHPQFYRLRHFILVNYLARVSGSKPPVRLNHEADAWLWADETEARALELNEPTRILLDKVFGEKSRNGNSSADRGKDSGASG